MLMMSHSRGSICLVLLASPYDKDHVESILNVQMHHEKCYDRDILRNINNDSWSRYSTKNVM